MIVTSRILRIVVSAILVILAANCFLKYMWWSACYSAWSGIPKMAEQWKAAGFRASFNLWCFVALDLASAAVLFTLLHLRSSDKSRFLKHAPRAMLALVITVFLTGLSVLARSWVKQGIH